MTHRSQRHTLRSRAMWLVLGFAIAAPPGVASAQSLGFISQWGGLGAGNGQFNTPVGIATDGSSKVFVTDYGNTRVQVFTLDGVYLGQWTTLGHGFSTPTGVAVSSSGDVYVSEHSTNRVQVFSNDGTFLRLWGSQGSGPGQFNMPYGIALGPDGTVYVVDRFNHRVQAFTEMGTFVRQWATETQPVAIATDPEGRVYVSARAFGQAERLSVYSSTGSLLDRFEVTLGCGARGIAVTSDRIFVVGGNRVCEFTSSGAYVQQSGEPGAGPGQFENPTALCVDPVGHVLVTDTDNHRVQKLGDVVVPALGQTWGRLKVLYR